MGPEYNPAEDQQPTKEEWEEYEKSQPVPTISLSEWLEERKENCIRIMADKPESEKQGWIEDALYFQAAIFRVTQLEAELAEARKDTVRLDWLNKKDRSAHQYEDHWAVWIDTSEDGDPICVEGDIREAIDAAMKEPHA